MYMQQPAYDAGFRAFARQSDERAITFEHLARRIRSYNIQSLLDIGSGADERVIELDRNLAHYVAIEHRDECVQALRAAGVNVIAETFPFSSTRLEQEFDAVLMSHSVPWHSDKYRPFISQAWKALKPGGRLFLVQYDDGKTSEWRKFLLNTGLKEKSVEGDRLLMLNQWLKTLPKYLTCPIATLETCVSAETREALVEALGFVYGGGRAERAEAFRTHPGVWVYIEEYFDGIKYRFPFSTVIMEVLRD